MGGMQWASVLLPQRDELLVLAPFSNFKRLTYFTRPNQEMKGEKSDLKVFVATTKICITCHPDIR